MNTRVTSLFLLLATSLGCSKSSTSADAAAALTESVSKPTFSDVTSDSLTLSWKAVSASTTAVGTISYQAFYTQTDPGSTTPSAATVQADWTAVGTSTANLLSVSIPSLSENTEYYFTVLGTDTENHITVYPIASQTTSEAPAGADADTTQPVLADPVLVASSVTTTGLTLSWTAGTDNVTSTASLRYQVYYSTSELTTLTEWQDSDQATQVGTAAAGLKTLNITGLTADAAYYFMVVISDLAGNSTLYTSLAQRTSIPTFAPGNSGILTISNVTRSGLTLAWSAALEHGVASDSAIYFAYVSTLAQDVASNAAIIAQNSTAVSKGFTTDTSISISWLSSNTTYYVNIIAANGTETIVYTPHTVTTSESTQVYLFANKTGLLTDAVKADFAASGGTVRSNVDALCNTKREASYASTCPSSTSVHAVFSASNADTMAGMSTTYHMPSSFSVVDVTNGYKIASSWTDMINNGPCNGSNAATCNATGSPAQSLLTALGLTTGGGYAGYFWSGSSTGGAYDAANTCNGWTNKENDPYRGAIIDGTENPGTSSWLSLASFCSANYGYGNPLLCVCW